MFVSRADLFGLAGLGLALALGRTEERAAAEFLAVAAATSAVFVNEGSRAC